MNKINRLGGLEPDGVRNIPEQLRTQAKSRTDGFVKSLEDAMKAIELEIDANDGLYPYNGGRLNQAEVCRRAGIRNGSLQGKAHKTTTKCMVDEWIARVTEGMAKGHRSVRSTVTQRADDWKEAHRKIAEAYHIDHLVLEKAQKRITELEEDNQTLRDQLAGMSGGKIISMPKKK